MNIKKITAFAAALVLAASAGTALPKFGYETAYAADSTSSLAPLPADDTSSQPEPEWTESEEEAAARELSITFDTVMVFKDGSEEKLDLDFERTYEKGYRSYRDNYHIELTHEEFEAMLAQMGKKYEDIDHFEYRMTVENGENTNYSKEYMLDVTTNQKITAHPENMVTPYKITKVMQGIDTTKTFEWAKFSTETYDLIDFYFSIDYSGAKVYKPTEAHKKAMLVTFDPSLAVQLKDGTLIPVNDDDITEEAGTYEDYYYAVDFQPEKLKKIITDAGKDPMDFLCFVGYVTPKYPTNSGISYDSVMENVTYGCNLEFTLKPEYEQRSGSARGYARRSMDFSEVPIEVGKSLEFNYIVESKDSDTSSRPQQRVEEITLDHVESIRASIFIDMHYAEIPAEGDTVSSRPDNSVSSKKDNTSSKADTSSKKDDTSNKADTSSKPDGGASSKKDNTSGKAPASSKPDASSKAKDVSTKPNDSVKPDDSSKSADMKFMKGDTNGDNEINVTDIAFTASHIKGIKALSGDQFNAADVNADKELTVTDIAMIASHIKGIKALS